MWNGTEIVPKRGLLFARTLDYKYIWYTENDLQNILKRKSACGYIHIQLSPDMACNDAVLKVQCLIRDDSMLRFFTGVEHTVESLCILMKHISTCTHTGAENRRMFVIVVSGSSLPSPSLFCFSATGVIRDEWFGLLAMYSVAVKHLPVLSKGIGEVTSQKIAKTKSLECTDYKEDGCPSHAVAEEKIMQTSGVYGGGESTACNDKSLWNPHAA